MQRRSILVSAVLVVFAQASGCASFTTAQGTQKHLEALDQWLDKRFDPKAPTAKAMAARLQGTGLDDKKIEALLRGGRASYPTLESLKLEKGALSAKLRLVCDHVDYETNYFLYIPRSYDPKRAWPLVLIGHGGNAEMTQERADTTAFGYVGEWIEAAELKGFIAVAPATARGWDWIGNSILFSVVSKLSRELHIDPDRIYATGHSMGGHMAWRSGIFFGDRFGAVGPMSGGYDYVANELVVGLFNVPGYATHGADEPYQIADFNRKIRKWMKEHGYDWTIVEKDGGHEIYADEVPKSLDFFGAHPRKLYRDKVAVRNHGFLRIDASEPKKSGWPQEHKWAAGRPIAADTCHWVRIFPLPKETPAEKKVQRAQVERKSKSEIVIVAKNCPKLRLLLHDSMFEFEKPLTIVANGKTTTVTPKRDLAAMLDLVREFDDRGRIFHGFVDVKIEGDADVPEPRP